MEKVHHEKLQILDDATHILRRLPMYAGSTTKRKEKLYLMRNGNVVHEEVNDYIPALLHIVGEILDNARDNVYREYKHKQTYIKVCMDGKSFSVENDGKPIPVLKETLVVPGRGKVNTYRAAHAFDNPKSSTNFNDNEKCICKKGVRNAKCGKCASDEAIGTNGVGAKLTLICSKYAEITHGDPDSQKQLKLVYEDNFDIYERDDDGVILGRKNKPKVTAYKRKKSYTKFYFEIDFERFGIKKFSKNHIDAIHATCASLSFVTGLKVHFNDEILHIKSLTQLAQLYFGKSRKSIEFKAGTMGKVVAMEQDINEMDKYGARHLSFINGTRTIDGGIHVTRNMTAIGQGLRDWYKKGITLTETKKAFIYIVNYNIVGKVEFQGQVKNYLDFAEGFQTVNVERKMFAPIKKWNLFLDLEIIMNSKMLKKANQKQKKGLAKGYIAGGELEVDDANRAGMSLADNAKCTMYLVEGNSAKQLLIECMGSNYNGFMATKGKCANTMSDKKNVLKPTYAILRKYCGLELGNTYRKLEDIKKLRYQNFIIATDRDNDGSHIFGIYMAYFLTQHPGLIEHGRVRQLMTPIIRVEVGSKRLRFYTMKEYDQHYKSLPQNKKQSFVDNTKYLKGLGGSDPAMDGPHIFGDNMVTNNYTFDDEDVRLTHIFFEGGDVYKEDKKRILRETAYNSEFKFEFEMGERKYRYFLRNDYACGTCAEQNSRAIPMCDGNKESQKDIMYTALYHMTKGTKTERMGAIVSTTTLYHHGEKNINDTCTRMAMNIIGTNNIPFFLGDGCFGGRHTDGSSHGASAPRYTHISVNPLMYKIFINKDINIFEWEEREGNKKATPVYLLPIIPYGLTKTIDGVGNGFSTKIPSYNPKDLVKWVRTWIENTFQDGDVEYEELVPWFRGFEGTIEKSKNGWTCKGIIEQVNKNKWEIKEIAPGRWGVQLKKYLSILADAGDIEKPEYHYEHNSIRATVKRKGVAALDLEDNLSKGMSSPLVNKLNTNNMTFIMNGEPRQYKNPQDFIRDYCQIRYDAYERRKNWELNDLKGRIRVVQNKIDYIEKVQDKKISFIKMENKEMLENKLTELKFKVHYIRKTFDYLTDMKSYQFTNEGLERFEKEYEKLVDEYNELKQIPAWQIWLNELDDFEKAYEKYLKKYPVNHKIVKKK